MITCPSCGAVCREKKDEKRFQRRHPKSCQHHARFQKDLAAATKSVDADEHVHCWARKNSYHERHMCCCDCQEVNV
jgi:adenine-specific DNA methylase